MLTRVPPKCTCMCHPDTFQLPPIGYRPVAPFEPKSNGNILGGADIDNFVSTSRASYVQHAVKPYTPARKPMSSLSSSAF